MKIIELLNGMTAKVDDCDYLSLSKYLWSAEKKRNVFYAVRKQRIDKKMIIFYMHREILGLKRGSKTIVDHLNRDGLDNQRANLIVCCPQHNGVNVDRIGKGYSSLFYGVSWSAKARKWSAFIRFSGTRKYLGSFNNEYDAAQAYNEAAFQYWGFKAKLNDIGEDHARLK